MIRLEALERHYFIDLIKRESEFRKAWVKNKRCACVKADKIINCVHVNKAIAKKFEKEEKRARTLFCLITLKELSPYPQLCSDFLKGIKR